MKSQILLVFNLQSLALMLITFTKNALFNQLPSAASQHNPVIANADDDIQRNAKRRRILDCEAAYLPQSEFDLRAVVPINCSVTDETDSDPNLKTIEENYEELANMFPFDNTL